MTNTFTYITQNEEVTISGFMAFLLLQGQDWDYRCVEADIRDYHQQQYARMDAREALIQELHWWIDAYETPFIQTHLEKEYLLSEGVYYLFDCARHLLTPDSDTDKLTTNMAIYFNDECYLYKINDDLAFFHEKSGPDFATLIHGFPAQLPAIRKLKAAIKQERPAAALAQTVRQLQQDGTLKSELRPLTHFIDAVNKVCNSDVKYDSFSKHFR